MTPSPDMRGVPGDLHGTGYYAHWYWPDGTASLSSFIFDLGELPAEYRKAEVAGAIAIAVRVPK